MTLRSKKIVSFSPRGIIGHLTERKEVLLSNPFRQYLDQFRFRIENMAEPAGTVKMSFAATEPEGWFFLNGQTVDERLYPDLAEIFGAVDGIITLPDYTDRIAMGAGSIVALNGTAGAETVTLTREEMPRHNHGVTDPGHNHGAADRGHTHGLQLDSHTHNVSEVEGEEHIHSVTDPGHTHTVTDPGHNHAITDPNHTHNVAQPAGSADSATGADTTSATSGTSSPSTTGISIDNATTGVSIASADTGIEETGESVVPLSLVAEAAEVTGSVLKSRADIRVHKSKTGIETVEDGDGKPFSITPPVFGVNWLVKA